MNVYIKLSVVAKDPAQKDLVVGMLSGIGFDGFEEELQVVHAYINASDYEEETTANVLRSIGVSYKSESIEEKNWNQEWEKNFKPVVFDQFCCIRAYFHPQIPGVIHDIIITPKMSFGTGHHPTTYLMIKQMSRLHFDKANVLDFGTGTGVLAILAEKMGAESVLAIDNDNWSIQNAGDNIAENACKSIRLLQADLIATAERFKFILANINRNVLLDQMHNLSQYLNDGGVLVMSGLLAGDKMVIEERARLANLRITVEEELEGWIVLSLIHN